MNNLLATIADPTIDKDTLVKTIRLLGAVDEDIKFWLFIAKSEKFTDEHRRYAVYALFKRHIHAPVILVALVNKLDHPTWVKNNEISIVHEIAGIIPVSFDAVNTIFVLPIFTATPDEHYVRQAIYLKVEGKISLTAFRNVFYGGTQDEGSSGKTVLEIGMSPEEI